MNADSYRDWLRSVLREKMTPTLDELLEGVPVNNLGMNELELYVETVTGVDPRILEPPGYLPRLDKRGDGHSSRLRRPQKSIRLKGGLSK